MTIDFAVIAATVLGFLFPACLVDAIRETDEEKVPNSRGKACVCFGFLVFLVLLIVRS